MSTIVAATALYLRGRRALLLRSTRAHPRVRRRTVSFIGGVLVIAVALLSPIDAAGNALFSVHMVQHLLLTMIAAPLLILGEPAMMTLWALPIRYRRAVGQWWRRSHVMQRLWNTVTRPFVAWVLHVTLLWAWHVPRFYDGAVRHEGLHVLEHTSFIASALLFWWVAAGGRRLGIGSATFYFFAAGLQCTLLGAMLTMAHTPWYSVHYGTTQPWGLSPLEDQQLAGLVMWIPAGIVYLVALLPRFALSLREHPVARSEAVLSS